MCPCGEKFNVQHALSCKKGGFITLRHNEVRDITATLLSEVCKDVEVESSLIKLQGEEQRLNNTAKNFSKKTLFTLLFITNLLSVNTNVFLLLFFLHSFFFILG